MSNDDLKQRIILALNNPAWDARTEMGIAKFAGCGEQDVRAVLTADPNLARKLPFPDKNGRTLYIPASRKTTVWEVLAKFKYHMGPVY